MKTLLIEFPLQRHKYTTAFIASKFILENATAKERLSRPSAGLPPSCCVLFNVKDEATIIIFIFELICRLRHFYAKMLREDNLRFFEVSDTPKVNGLAMSVKGSKAV